MRPGDFSLWLYGSWARGDRDHLSDVDLLLCGPSSIQHEALARFPSDRMHISAYSWDELSVMTRYGSLFLHHIREEGQELDGRGPARKNFLGRLSRLGPYIRWRRDLRAFYSTLTDVEDAVLDGSSPVYEMGVVATVLRHSAVLGCYLLGRPAFGRTTAFPMLAELLGLPTAASSSWGEIYLFKLFEDHRVALPYIPSNQEVLEQSARVRKIIVRIEEAYRERRALSTPA